MRLLLAVLIAMTCCPDTGAATCDTLYINAVAQEDTAVALTDTLRHYENFLGEKCLDMGKTEKCYGWKRDVTYAGLPLIASALVIKEKKRAFSPADIALTANRGHEIENYTRFAPYALIAGLKLAGYEGRSDWPRLVTSAAASNVIMAAAVSVAKHSFKETRPDGSDSNSFPSGHAAVAFAAATVLHKEYGMTRSPWFSVGGYAVATGTSVLRVAHNRHWVSDIAAGAGIGILSAELGYFIGDLIHGNRGLQRPEQKEEPFAARPSFIDVQMGVGMRSQELRFTGNDGMETAIDLCTSTVAGMEGAYFLTGNIGVGGMARVTTTPADMTSLAEICGAGVSADDNIFTDVALDAGIFADFTVGKTVSLGAKVLCGARLSDGISLVKDDPSSVEVMAVKGGSALNFVAGISASWRYRDCFAWKIFADMDTAKAGYTLTGLPSGSQVRGDTMPLSAGMRKQMTCFTVGGAFSVRF